ncbi:coiled-coil domain-containing protein 14 isoform X2 [Solea solea]|uniref:coiled-coil domain-containing protein 14 isoform X2 n=1 Tax=Solea solea TaxID=90069 RepID=UPI00272B6E46|nr:coiled-coil domain-containing protein 14 isoform X2 [Solea solea]
MKATNKHKVVTSGRLTGGVKGQQARRPATASAHPEPAFSLYSTDSEEQVISLHEGLDRCAALLTDILQADLTASPSPPKAAMFRAAKSRPSTSLKKTVKKLPKKTAQNNPQSLPRGAASTTPRRGQKSPAAHSGVKLQPPQRPTPRKFQASPSIAPNQLQTSVTPTQTPISSVKTSIPFTQTSIPPFQPQSSVLLSVNQSSSQPGRAPLGAEHDVEEEESVPVRDINTHRAAKDTRTAVGHVPPHVLSCSSKVSNMRLDPGHVDEIPQDAHISIERAVKEKKVEYLLGELKALLAGQGSISERLLGHLEEAVTLNVNSESLSDPSSLHSQNIQLRRRVRILNQQLMEKEKAERRQNTHCNSGVTILQDQLTAAQWRLQELQHDLTELREALQDTRSELRGREAENTIIRTDLEATKRRLVDVEREKSELASFFQQRLEENGNLKRLPQSQDSSARPPVMNNSVMSPPHQPPTERITHYLMSLDRPGPARAQHASADTEKGGGVRAVDIAAPPVLQSHCSRERRLDSTLSQCDAESEWSESTFNTRDEMAFRDGLEALDASIASLQKTLQLDLRR